MRLYFTLIVLFLSSIIYAQNHTISGTVVDKSSGESLVNATIMVKGTGLGCVSNAFGFYSITLPKGEYTIEVSYVGYELYSFLIQIEGAVSRTIKMKQSATIDEVQVIAEQQREISSSRMSSLTLNAKQTQKLPTLLGEPDMVKLAQLVAGVETGTEGSSGLHVRGGDNGQNLILIDGIPVYNVSHMMGFVSVFNPEAVQHTEIIKGGIPARYGGRVSGVLDVRMKEGNQNKLKGTINVGTLLAGGSIEGPLGEKTGFMLTARRTMLDPVYARFNSANGVSDNLYTCWDVNAKINHKINAKNRIFASFYGGNDYSRGKGNEFEYSVLEPVQEQGQELVYDTINRSVSEKEQHRWGNVLGAMRWNHVWSPKIYSNVKLFYSKFYNSHSDERNIDDFNKNTDSLTQRGYLLESKSDIQDLGLGIDFDYFVNPQHYLRFGYQGIYHNYFPQVQLNTFGSQRAENNAAGIPAFEHTLYIEDEFSMGEKIKCNVGGRLVSFESDDVSHVGFEPRISLAYVANANWSVKSSYTQTAQFVHLVSPSSVGFSTDYWIPASKALPAEKVDQWGLGTAIALPRNLLLTVEGYYKNMHNVIAFRDDRFFNSEDQDWESFMCSGKGWAYGIESMLHKKQGKLSGWIAYTWARSFRQMEALNFGEAYPYKYDRPHNLTIVANYALNEKWDFGANWILASGYNFSFPMYELGYMYYHYGTNNMRYPAYHRLDVGVNWHKQKNKGKRTWRFGAYNAYCHMNTSYYRVYIDHSVTSFNPELAGNSNSSSINVTSVTLFPFIPYLSFRFAFGE